MNATDLMPNNARVAMYPAIQDDELNASMFTLRETLPAGVTALPSISHSLFAQLRSRYPTGALTSELVQVHENQFVVRALVQVSGTVLATGMAAADRVEVAEDRARVRAMEVLGIAPASVSTSPSSPAFEVPKLMAETPSEPEFSESSLETISPPESSEAATLEDTTVYPEQKLPEVATPSRRGKKKESLEIPPLSSYQSDDFSSALPSREVSEPVTKPESIEMEYDYAYDFEPETASTEPAVPAKVTVPDVAQHLDPIDLSDAIAQIGTEIERIGWTKKQGSTYLQQTYGKKTRAELTEDELLEFLHYLKALPSKGHPSLSQIPF